MTPPTSTSAIHVLPYELIVEVFIHLRLNELVVASHVCQFWRNVAIGTNVFWINLFRPPLKAIPTMVRRAKNVPVSLTVVCSSETLFRTLCATLNDQLGSFGYLSINIDRSSTTLDNRVWDWPQLWRALHNSAPKLESFTLRCNGFASVLPSNGDHELFCGDAPKLRNLDLQGFELDKPIVSLARVTCLHASAYSLAQLQALEDYFPDLAELGMYNISTLPCPPLRLPNLRKLDLTFQGDRGDESDEDWRAVISWLLESRVASIPKLSIHHSHFDVQGHALKADLFPSHTLYVCYRPFEGYYKICVDGEAGAWREVVTPVFRQVQGHMRAASLFCNGATRIRSNVLEQLCFLDERVLPNITTIEVPVPGKVIRGLLLDFDMHDLPVFPNVETWNVMGTYRPYLSGTTSDINVDAYDVLAFARHSFPNVKTVRLVRLKVSHVDILGKSFTHFQSDYKLPN